MKVKRSARIAGLLLFGLLAVGHAHGQSTIGVPVPPLGEGPWVFDTAEQHRIRVSVVTRGLSHPWAIAFLPEGGMLITERPGRLRVVRDDVLDPHAISGVPQVRTDGNGGLMDVALHPQFSENGLVYLTYTKPVENGWGAPALAVGRLEAGALSDVKDLVVTKAFEGNSGLNGRVAFGRDGKVYMSTGGRVENAAQDPMSLRGKVLRLNDDGTVPPDNPFVDRQGYRPEIYTLGHRNTLGLMLHPETGALWQHENGPNGGDEINILAPRPQLRLAGRQLRTQLLRRPDYRASDARRNGIAPRGLATCDRGRRYGGLHGRPVPRVERQRLRRIASPGWHTGHGPPSADRLQRENRGVAAASRS